MVKLKIKLPIGGHQSKAQSAEVEKGEKEGNPPTKNAAAAAVVEQVVDLTGDEEQTKRPPPQAKDEKVMMEKSVGPSASLSFEIPDHTRVSDYRTAGFGQLASNFAEQTYRSLQELCIDLSGSDVSDEERKQKLLMFLNEARQRLIRLLVLVNFHDSQSKKVDVLEQCINVLQNCENYTLGLRGASDNLAFLHDELRSLLQPLYDTRTAMDILCNKKAPLMPTSILDVGEPIQQSAQRGQEQHKKKEETEEAQKYALRRLSILSYMKVLRERTAVHEEDPRISLKVEQGRTHIICPHLFQVVIALDPFTLPTVSTPGEEKEKEREKLNFEAKWVMQDLNLLMGSCDYKTIVSGQQTMMMRHRLQMLLDTNVGNGKNANASPILSVVKYLKEMCSKLVIYTCSSQLNDLLAENHKGKLRKLIQKEDSSQEGLLRCLYWIHAKKTVKTYVELSLDGNGYSCKNIYETGNKRHETEFKFSTRSISMESIVWQGASLTCAELIKRFSAMLGKDRHFQKLLSLGIAAKMSLRESIPTGELGFFLSGTPILTMNIDVYTGTLLFSACGNDRSNLRILSLLRQFRQKHFSLLSSTAELLVNEQSLMDLLGHVNLLLENVHGCMVLDEVFGLLWLTNKAQPLREVPLDIKNAVVWDTIKSGVGKYKDILLLNKLGTQSYVAFLITGSESIVSFSLRIGWRFNNEGKADQLLLEEKELLCELDLSSFVLGDGRTGREVKASRKRKLDQDLEGRENEQQQNQKLLEFVKLTTSKLAIKAVS